MQLSRVRDKEREHHSDKILNAYAASLTNHFITVRKGPKERRLEGEEEYYSKNQHQMKAINSFLSNHNDMYCSPLVQSNTIFQNPNPIWHSHAHTCAHAHTCTCAHTQISSF